MSTKSKAQLQLRQQQQQQQQGSKSNQRLSSHYPDIQKHTRSNSWAFLRHLYPSRTSSSVLISEEATWDDFDYTTWSSYTTSRAPSAPNGILYKPIITTDDTTLDTQTFWNGIYYPSARNGTPVAQALHHPGCAARELTNKLRSLNTASLKAKLQGVIDAAGQQLNERLNESFEGRDAVELGNQLVDLLMQPALSMADVPRLVEAAAEKMCDAAQRLLPYAIAEAMEKEEEEEEFGEYLEMLQGNEWVFARMMGRRARRILVQQRICHELQTTTLAPWCEELNHVLAGLFQQQRKEYSVKTLFDMKPVWQGDVEKKGWRLLLDTGAVDLTGWSEESTTDEKAIVLDSGFTLPEEAGQVQIEDMERDMRGREEGWLEVQ